MFKLRPASRSKKSHSSFCSPLTSTEFLAVAANLSSFTTTSPDNVIYPAVNHLSRFDLDLRLVLNLSWSLHFLLPSASLHLVFPFTKWENFAKSCFLPAYISLNSCISKLFERIILSSLLFLESDSILSARQASFSLDPGSVYFGSNSVSFSLHFRWV